MLYDLQNDPGERDNLAATHPATVSRLQSAFDKWNRELPQHSILPAQRSTVVEMHGETVQLIF